MTSKPFFVVYAFLMRVNSTSSVWGRGYGMAGFAVLIARNIPLAWLSANPTDGYISNSSILIMNVMTPMAFSPSTTGTDTGHL